LIADVMHFPISGSRRLQNGNKCAGNKIKNMTHYYYDLESIGLFIPLNGPARA